MGSHPHKILGIDYGARRIGVAIADLGVPVAIPLEVIDGAATDPIKRLSELIASHGVSVVVVGRPKMLSGDDGTATQETRAFAASLQAATGVEIQEIDERMTTVIAERRLRTTGVDGARRKGSRDAVAAQVILQSYLDGLS